MGKLYKTTKDGRDIFKEENGKLYTYINGKKVECYEYKGAIQVNDWKRKFDRFCGISDKEFHNPTKRTTIVHTLQFLGITALVGVASALFAYFVAPLIF